jgi:hypothetical protein
MNLTLFHPDDRAEGPGAAAAGPEAAPTTAAWPGQDEGASSFCPSVRNAAALLSGSAVTHPLPPFPGGYYQRKKPSNHASRRIESI